jgi:signal transduction histidine kinase
MGSSYRAAVKKPRVLIVEDDVVVAALLSEAADDAGFETRIAGNGGEALTLCKRWRPDLAVLDVGLPDSSGVDVASSLRGAGDIPFIFLTACAEESVVAQAMELGALAYLVKPLDLGALGPMLRTALARGNERRNFAERMRQLTAVASRDAEERERRQLGAELHDGLGQELTGAALIVRAIERRLARAGRNEDPDIQALRSILEEAQAQCRSLSHEKFSGSVRGVDLGRALRRLVRTEAELRSMRCTYSGPTDMPSGVTDPVAHQLFRVAQEAVRNAGQHSGGSRIAVSLSLTDREVTLAIRDNGRGRPANTCTTACGIGCQTMQFRAQILGGTLKVQDAPRGGTEVIVTVPLAGPELAVGRPEELGA